MEKSVISLFTKTKLFQTTMKINDLIARAECVQQIELKSVVSLT